MKAIYTVLLFFMAGWGLFAQPQLDYKRDRVWVFGYDTVAPAWGITVMDFNTMNGEAPSMTYTNEEYIWLTFTYDGICDTAGNLQFYTNGIYVYNANHQILDSGAVINDCTNMFLTYYPEYGYRVIQGAIILPLPGSLDRYHILHVPLTLYDNPVFYSPLLVAGESSLYHSVVDMGEPNGQGGMGKLIAKNQLVIPDSIGAGMLTACRHANGRDWWILVRELHRNRFYRCLLSPSGLSVEGSQEIGDPVYDLFGQAAFSPDGSKFVIYGGYDNLRGQYIHLYDFDRCTGLLSNPLTQNRHARCWTAGGVTFSPNSRYLYLTQSWQCSDTVGAEMMVMDVQQPDPFITETLIARADSFTETNYNLTYRIPFFWMQPGPDGKIYVSGGNTRHMGVIHDPDAGALCDFRQHSLQLPSLNGNSMPNNPNFRLGAVDGSACDTLGIGAWVSVPSPKMEVRPSIALYPNPASGTVHLVWYHIENGEGEAVLKDGLGRVVYQKAIDFVSQEVDLALEALPSGVYYLTVTRGGIPVGTEKLIVTE